MSSSIFTQTEYLWSYWTSCGFTQAQQTHCGGLQRCNICVRGRQWVRATRLCRHFSDICISYYMYVRILCHPTAKTCWMISSALMWRIVPGVGKAIASQPQLIWFYFVAIHITIHGISQINTYLNFKTIIVCMQWVSEQGALKSNHKDQLISTVDTFFESITIQDTKSARVYIKHTQS